MPSWSPDGTKIVFDRYVPNTNAFDIFVMIADGTNQVDITNMPGWELGPKWSPDGGISVDRGA